MEPLNRLERAWVLYDVGNSAFVLMTSTIIPIFFKNLAASAGISDADSTAYWSYAAALCTLIVAVLGPTLGAVADTKGFKKPLFLGFVLTGCLCCAVLSLPAGWLAFLALFVVAKVGYSGSLIFYDAMLTDVTDDRRMDMVSSKGYAWGYLGSCIPFVACLLLVLTAEQTGLGTARATAVAFVITAIWWLGVSLPLLRAYRQVHFVPRQPHLIRTSFRRLGRTLADIRGQKQVFLFLLAFFFYIDGVYTIIDLATSYGKDVGIGDTDLVLALLLTQVVAFPCSLLFARLARRFRPEQLIQVCIGGYFFIALFALQLDTAWEFWFLAVCVAVFQGAIQALSRSYYAQIIPKEKAAEYFGFFDIFGKGASFFGALLMGLSTQLFDTSKAGVAALALLFPIGLVLLRRAARTGTTAAPVADIQPQA